MSAATAMVVGVAAGSAFFVDYLADRAKVRTVSTTDTRAVITASVPETAAASSASGLVDSAAAAEVQDVQPQPVRSVGPSEPVPLEPVPIEATLPDPEVLAKVVVAGSERAGDSPVLQFNGEEAEGDTNAAGAFEALTTNTPSPAPRDNVPNETVEVAALPGVETQDVPAAAGSRNLGGLPPGTARVTSSVNMRSGPKKGAGILGVVPRGTQVTVISCDGWCQITHEGRNGWVYKSFLAASAAPAPQKAQAPDQEPAQPVRGVRSPRLQN